MQISVVIPTLNEAAQISECIARTRQLSPHEIVVVDGGSEDDTRARAAAADQVLESVPGRAAQQNCGAAACSGDVLVFLHADSWFDPDAFEHLARALEDPRVIGGGFRQRIGAPGLGYRLLEKGNTLRARWPGWIYGDQGIFVRRTVFEELGGFPDLPLMEDLYFSKQLRRAGRVVILPARIHTSARRWQRRGLLRQTLQNWRLIALAHAGVPIGRLAAAYRQVR